MRPDYRRYMLSPEWSACREAAILRADFCCEFCGEGRNPLDDYDLPFADDSGFQVHHITYANFKHEPPEDLIVLCLSCHADAHSSPKRLEEIRAFTERRNSTEAA